MTEVEVGAWVSEAALWTQWTHVGRCCAQANSELAVVGAESLMKVVRSRRAVGQMSRTYAKNFHANLVASTPPHSPWPSDVSSTHFTDLIPAQVGCGLLDS